MKEEQCLDEESFDYEILHHCQWEVDGIECGEPAIAKSFWLIENKRDGVYLCNKHLQFILKWQSNERR